VLDIPAFDHLQALVNLPTQRLLAELIAQEDALQCFAQFAQRPLGLMLHVVFW
jgi:hypothetical protein